MAAADALVIRAARAEDLPGLGALGAGLMRVHHAFDAGRFMAPGPQPEAGYAAFLEAQMREPSTVVLVAEQLDAHQRPAIVGYLYGAIEPANFKELREQAGFVHDVYVAAHARDAGVGHRLLEAGLVWFRARGVDRVLLWTAAANSGARRLFEAHGFAPTMIEMTLELR